MKWALEAVTILATVSATVRGVSSPHELLETALDDHGLATLDCSKIGQEFPKFVGFSVALEKCIKLADLIFIIKGFGFFKLN